MRIHLMAASCVGINRYQSFHDLLERSPKIRESLKGIATVETTVRPIKYGYGYKTLYYTYIETEDVFKTVDILLKDIYGRIIIEYDKAKDEYNLTIYDDYIE